MSPHPRPALRSLLALTLAALALIAGCSSVSLSPETHPTQLAPIAVQPSAKPSSAKEAQESYSEGPVRTSEPAPAPVVSSSEPAADLNQDELEANLSLHSWITAISAGNADHASYLYRLEAGADPAEIDGHIKALQHFIESAEDPANTSFGSYNGFHEITGNYIDEITRRRVGIALMQFERTFVCFRADLVKANTLWSIERWEPIQWTECEAEIGRLPVWVRHEWRDVLP